MKKSLLIQEPPLQVLPTLAKQIGLNEAIVLQQLHYWIENPKTGILRDGFKWVFNTYEEWRENFPFWSESTIQRIFTNLEKGEYVISAQLDKHKHDMRKFYRPNYELIDVMDDSNLTSSNTSTCYDVNSITKTTTETTSQNETPDPIFTSLEQLTGGLNSNTTRFVDTWREKHTDEKILQAIEEAKTRKARSVKYIDEILVSWEANGYPKTRDERVQARKKTDESRPQYSAMIRTIGS